MSVPKLVHFEGDLVRPDQAVISLLSPAVMKGPIAYETFRGYWSDDQNNLFLFRLRDHLSRLTASMKILRFQETFDPEDLVNRILELIRTNEFHTGVHAFMHVYPLDEDGPGRTSARSGIIINANPRPQKNARIARCQVSTWLRRGGDGHPARVKAVGLRMFARAALAQAELDGYTHLIYQDDRGKIAEGSSSNIFIVRRGVLATPAITDQILEGVTRDTILSIAGDLGIPCAEREVDRSELYDCEEAFLCSTALEILPIESVDGLNIADGSTGPVTNRIRSRYRAHVYGQESAHSEWLTPVY